MLENSVHKRIICNTLYLKNQTIHSVIYSGVVYLEPSPENSKIKMIILTEKIKAIYEKTAIFLAAEERAFGRLTPQERTTLIKLTKKNSNYLKNNQKNY